MVAEATDRRPVKVEMIADLACPWCYLGLIRLDKARALRPRTPVVLRWWPYLLNPQLPKEGMERRTYLRAKFGSDGHASQIYQRIEAAGREEGIPFAFDKMTRTPNTTLAQRLILLAQGQGKGESLIHALFKALFEQGIDIGKAGELAAIGRTTGLDPDDIEALFAGSDHAADVIRGHQRASMIGVQGVPVYVIDREHVITGAQAPEVLAGLPDVARMDSVA